MSDWLYAALCVVAPCAVGGVMFAAFEVWDRRWRRAGENLPLIDYSI